MPSPASPPLPPPPTAAELQGFLDLGTDLAWRAGRIALRYFQAGVAVDTKSDLTPVTAADRESEKFLRAEIGRRLPDHGILGEEFGHERPAAPYQWIIDPIDGTRSFVRGVPFFGVLIGLTLAGAPIAGVCYLPALDEMVCAARGLGCRWNGRPARVSEVDTLREAGLMLTDVRPFAETGKLDAYRRLAAATALERTWGDCYGHVLVATGRAEVMLDALMNVWDCAALVPILTEAGGTFTDWKGRTVIDGGDAISTNGRLFEAVMGCVRGA